MEELLVEVVGVLITVVEACGAAVIITGAVRAFPRFVAVGLRRRDAEAFVPVRLTLGRFLALGLKFQLASDVLRTAVAPSSRELDQLAAVAAIRTALNYLLSLLPLTTSSPPRRSPRSAARSPRRRTGGGRRGGRRSSAGCGARPGAPDPATPAGWSRTAAIPIVSRYRSDHGPRWRARSRLTADHLARLVSVSASYVDASTGGERGMPAWTVRTAGDEVEQVEAGMLATEGGALIAISDDGLVLRAWAPGQWWTVRHVEGSEAPMGGLGSRDSVLLGLPRL